MAKILVVEDDREINKLLCDFLQDKGYDTESAFDGNQASECIKKSRYILVLMDLMLPYKDGNELITEIRAVSNTPVICISARSGINTRLNVLRMGADDYIIKPFDLDEVLVRIEVVLRRSGGGNSNDYSDDGTDNIFGENSGTYNSYKKVYKNHNEYGNKIVYSIGRLSLDTENNCAYIDGDMLGLTAKEFQILKLMKSQLKKISEELISSRDDSYNSQISVTLIDKCLSEMTVEINNNLEYQKKLKMETERKERNIRQSISDIAHDLRTPLTVINGNLQLIDRAAELSDKDKSRIDICVKKSEVLKNMVDEFFELSVLESEQTAPDLQRVDITAYLIDFLLENEALIEKNGLRPDLQIPEKSLWVMADTNMLHRIFSNLLNNVVRHAEDEFAVAVNTDCTDTSESNRSKNPSENPELGQDDKHCCVTFSNPILPEASLDTDHLFDRSYRGDKSRFGEGAGLGLYIVKLLVEKQGGRVCAKIENGRLYIITKFRMIQ